MEERVDLRRQDLVKVFAVELDQGRDEGTAGLAEVGGITVCLIFVLAAEHIRHRFQRHRDCRENHHHQFQTEELHGVYVRDSETESGIKNVQM